MGLVGAVRILRIGNALMAAAGVAIGFLGVGGALRHDEWRYLAPLSAFLITCFGNVLNDLHDQALDRTAHPHRPLASGQLTPRTARGMAWALAAGGVAVAYWPGDAILAVVAAAVVATLVLYEAVLKAKGFLGNLAVGVLTAVTFAFGALATDQPPAAWGPLWVLIAMAAFVNIGREVVKDIQDFDADRHRRRTLPHRTGTRRAAGIASVAVACGVGLNLGWLAATGLWDTALAGLVGADLVLLGSMAIAARQPATAQRGLKLGMALALAVFAVHVTGLLHRLA